MSQTTDHSEDKFKDLFDSIADNAVDGIIHHEVPPERAIVEVCKAQLALWTEMYDGDVRETNKGVLDDLNHHFDIDNDRKSALKENVDTSHFENADYQRLAAFVRMTTAVEQRVYAKLRNR